jgi:hypothetical protein
MLKKNSDVILILRKSNWKWVKIILKKKLNKRKDRVSREYWGFSKSNKKSIP